MEEKNPYDKLLDEIAALLQMFDANKNVQLDDARLSPNIVSRIEKLQKDVEAFEKLGKKVLETSYEIPESLKDIIPSNDEELPPEAKRIINKSNELLAKADSLQLEIVQKDKSNIQKGSIQEAAKTKKELDKGSGMKRKGKFRHLGGDFNRPPL